MRLKNEAKEAAAKVLEASGWPVTADAVRSEEEMRGCLPVTLAAIRATLEVLATLEEVVVRRNKYDGESWYTSKAKGFGRALTPSFVVYMRKPEPAPTTEELGLRLCEAVEGMPSGDEARKCASAFREALDK